MAKLMTLATTVVIITMAIGALIISPSFVGDNPSVSPPERRGVDSRPIPVIVEPVVLEPERIRIEAVGTSRAIRSVTLYPAASGEIEAVNFSANQRITADRILLELDRRDAELALALAAHASNSSGPQSRSRIALSKRRSRVLWGLPRSSLAV